MAKENKKIEQADAEKLPAEAADKHEEVAVKKDAEITVKEDITTLAPAAAATDKKKFDVKAFLRTKKGKIVAALLAVVLVVAVVFAVPASRYAVAGLVIKKDVHVELVDSETGKPVSAADVKLGNETLKTDANGHAVFKQVAVGPQKVSATKNYYENAETETTVPILRDADKVRLEAVATGRQVPVSVTNKISGAALAGVEIFAGDSTATTAENGEAVIVLPADKSTMQAVFKLAGHNDVNAEITVTEQQDDKNKFALTPNGRVYFLSKRTGKINVMSSNLDGSDQKVVVEGTGRESQHSTSLFATRDWKYLALFAKRDDKDKLYLINTADGKLSVMDEGDVNFTLYGWQNDHFVYTVMANNKQSWDANRFTLKSFNASNGKLTKLDTVSVSGDNQNNWAHETFGGVALLNDRIVYAKNWSHAYFAEMKGRKDAIYSIKATGEGKQTLKESDSETNGYFEVRKYKTNAVAIRENPNNGANSKFYVYADGRVEESKEVTDDNYYADLLYFTSPDGKKTFWHESRDGKFALLVGDADGNNGKEIMSSDYRAYGWAGNEYLLVTKTSSEMFVLPVGANSQTKPLKITDYHGSAANAGYMY
jgi:Tol biopolymer transport system component